MQALFPMDGLGQVALITDPKLHLGSRLAVVTRKPLDDVASQTHSLAKGWPLLNQGS